MYLAHHELESVNIIVIITIKFCCCEVFAVLLPPPPPAENIHALGGPIGSLTLKCIKLGLISNATRLHSSMSSKGLTAIVLCTKIDAAASCGLKSASRRL